MNISQCGTLRSPPVGATGIDTGCTVFASHRQRALPCGPLASAFGNEGPDGSDHALVSIHNARPQGGTQDFNLRMA